MQAIAFEQTMDRLCEEGYLDVEVHIVPVEVYDSESGEMLGYKGERRTPKKAVANKTLKKIYTVLPDKEVMLVGRGGDAEAVEENEKIELASTEHEMRGTCFFIVRPKAKLRSPLRRVALQFGSYKRVIPRSF